MQAPPDKQPTTCVNKSSAGTNATPATPPMAIETSNRLVRHFTMFYSHSSFIYMICAAIGSFKLRSTNMRLILAPIIMSIVCLQNAAAVSLNDHIADDSVCDLSPYTTSRLGQLAFVPSRTPNLEEIYTRLALRFIVGACRDGQMLILHSDDGSNYEDRYFTNVATMLCGTANTIREQLPTAEEPHSFRVKCRITRLKAAEIWLRSAERSQSTESMIAKGSAIRNESDQAEAGKATRDRQSRCKRGLTYGALIGISGGCRD